MNYTGPKIVTPPPGPKAKELIEQDNELLSPSLTRSSELVGSKAEGVYVEDVDGNVFLDFGSGIAVTALGHRHPKVIEAMKNQLDKLIFINSLDYYTIPQIEYAQMLTKVTPGKSRKKVFFTNSGSESVDTAIKMAKWHNRRPYGIGFINGFHGRTMGAVSFTTTGLTARRGFAPLYPIGQFTPYPYCYRCMFNKEYPSCGVECLGYLSDTIFKKITPPDETSFILLEPIQGAGGYIVPPKEFFTRLAALAEEHGILLILDEVQTGFGRTGKMFASEHFDLEPDIMTISKAIAHGMPCGAAVAKAEVMDWVDNAHEGTLNGGPVIMEAAKAVLTVIKEEDLLKAAEVKGAYLKEQLNALQSRLGVIGDVRGLGLMVGIEFISDDKKTPAAELRNKLIEMAFQKGLLLLGAGESSIRIAPPLIITREQIDTGLSIIEDCLKVLG
ncbi:MAG: aminotransferase class III-fold pyridoxal phosphate-dependent enzyme [Spirochaetales bacterium]|jgi:4-aminobutyrate aminotransferase|nr:aminotransferase class III-fold pyridoxal phosphate-dependent enzyme [Spirochaetales bacterium]